MAEAMETFPEDVNVFEVIEGLKADRAGNFLRLGSLLRCLE